MSAVDEIKTNIVGQEIAHRVEVTRIEPVYIVGEPFVFAFRECNLRSFPSVLGKCCEPRPAAMQRRFHRRNGGVHDQADLLEPSAR